MFCGHCANYRPKPFCESECAKTGKVVGFLWKKPCFEKKNESNEIKSTSNKDMEERTKVCKCCGRELPISSFQKQVKSKDGYMHICRECKGKSRTEEVVVCKAKDEPIGLTDSGFPQTQDKFDRFQEYTSEELVGELRFRGWEVKCIMVVEI